jgi:translation initiation factor IF-2
MNISTLAKVLGVSVNELRSTGEKNRLKSFGGRNTRIPYNEALEITKILRPDKAEKLSNDDKIYVPSMITVSDLADTIGRPAGMVIKSLLMNGVMATLNERIDFDTASLISSELGIEVFPDTISSSESQSGIQNLTGDKIWSLNEMSGEKVTRNPVVTIMGHVDHGKTSLLDFIRKSNVVASEAGAITQHIASYKVTYNDKKITFVDTPGHEAFSAMRARGTQLADFIILVVSATEGPKPQTVEVIERAKISKTPMIVAINKTDLPEADVEKVKGDIAALGVVPEEWGGNTPFIPLSAKTGDGINKLLDTILLHSEVADLVGYINTQPTAVVIESHLDKNQGVVATLLVTSDEIKVGDIISYGEHTGKIRKITDSLGKDLTSATMCEPVEISGLSEIANTGDIVKVFSDAKSAQEQSEIIKGQNANKKIFQPILGEDDDIVKIIIKTDVLGSMEALQESIVKIPQNSVKIVILSQSVGEVTETDVEYAITTGASIIAFHTYANSKILQRIKQEQIGLVQSDIIYVLTEWLEDEVLRKTKHETKITVLGAAKVLAVFKSEKPKEQVFGGEVIDGKFLSSKGLRIIRGNEIVGNLSIIELQKNKSKVNEVNISQQFGVSATGRGIVQVGDIVECIDETVVS